MRVGYPLAVSRLAAPLLALPLAFTLLAVGLGLPTSAHAHDREDDDRPRPTWGGWGHATVGIFTGGFGQVGRHLDDADALGDTIRFRPFGVMLGGGGRALLAGRYLLGGKGFAMIPQGQITEKGRAVMLGGGGGLDVGLVLYNGPKWMVYPLAGAGGYGTSLLIHNQSEEDVVVSRNITLTPGEQIDLTAGFVTFEIGVGVGRSAFWGDPRSGGAGGMFHGLEAGILMSVSEDRWKTPDDITVAIPPASLLGGYLRMNIGGGGFFYR